MDYYGLNLTTPTIPKVGFSEARKSYELQKREEAFMNFNRCSRCGGFFMAEGDTCPNCLQRDKFEMNRLENFIEENPNTSLNMNDIASNTGISDKNLNRFLANEQFNEFINKNISL